jgi:hypothetical protein
VSDVQPCESVEVWLILAEEGLSAGSTAAAHVGAVMVAGAIAWKVVGGTVVICRAAAQLGCRAFCQ